MAVTYIHIQGSNIAHVAEGDATKCGFDNGYVRFIPVSLETEGFRLCQGCALALDTASQNIVSSGERESNVTALPDPADFARDDIDHPFDHAGYEAAKTIEISMSDLDTFKTCRKKFEFSFIRGWQPRTATWAMVIGTAYHAKLAAGYRAVQTYDSYGRTKGIVRSDNDRALEFKEHAVAETPEHDRDGKLFGLTQGDLELLDDMVLYWFEQKGEADLREIAEIISVEEPYYMQVGPYNIRCTLDAVVRYFGEPDTTVIDHKTGEPQKVASWIYLDTQTPIYYIVTTGRYGKITQFKHQWMHREVPPGFGHRSLLTDTGKERSKATLASMQDPEKYVSVVKTELNGEQLSAYTAELVDVLQEIDHCKETGRWLRRSPIKVGPMTCESCPYFRPCVAERMGQPPMDDSVASTFYVVRDSAEWKKIQAGEIALEVKD